MNANLSPNPSTECSTVTMSSVEIAELTGKQHRDVMRDIRSIFKQAEIDLRRFAQIEKYANNRKRTIYQLPRAECDLVISGYSVKYRWAIIQRWHELEKQTPAPQQQAVLPTVADVHHSLIHGLFDYSRLFIVIEDGKISSSKMLEKAEFITTVERLPNQLKEAGPITPEQAKAIAMAAIGRVRRNKPELVKEIISETIDMVVGK